MAHLHNRTSINNKSSFIVTGSFVNNLLSTGSTHGPTSFSVAELHKDLWNTLTIYLHILKCN